jgi:hypothetical protein
MTHETRSATPKVSRKVSILGATLSLLIPAAIGGCGDSTSKPTTPAINVTVGAMLPRTGPNANSDWVSAVELAHDDIASAVKASKMLKQPVTFTVEEKDTASDETMAHDAMMAYSADGAKIVITEASNAAIGSNKWNYEQIDNATGVSPLPVISFTATSASLNNPTATDMTPARQDALRDPANWFYRTCPVSNNLSQIRLNEIFGGLVPGTNGDVNNDGFVKVVWIGSLDTSTQSSITGDITAVKKYLGTPAGMAAIGTKTFISENVSFDPGADPTSFDYTPFITLATDAHNEQTMMDDYVPDLIINKALPNIAIPFIKAYKQNAMNTYNIFQDGSFRRNTLLVALGTAADGQVGVSNIAVMNNASGTLFASEQSAKTGYLPAAYESQGYDAMALALLAVIKASVDNRPAITDATTMMVNPALLTPDMVHTALDQLNTPNADVTFGTGATEFAKAIAAFEAGQSVNYNGASGNVDFDPPAPPPAVQTFGDTYDYATLWKIQGGVFKETQFFNCLPNQNCASVDPLPAQ